MRIALLTDGIHPYVLGGMQKHSFYMAKYLAINKVHVDLYHPVVKNEEKFLTVFSSEEAAFIHPYFVSFPEKAYFPGHYIYESYGYSKNVYKKYIQNDPVDFIYAQGFAGWELISKKKKGNHLIAPIGVNFHGLNMFQPAFGIRNQLNNLLFKPYVAYNLRNADVVFSLGARFYSLIKEQIEGVKHIVEIPVGIDDSWLVNESEIKNNKIVSFVFVGRYDKVKGIDLLNKVIQRMINKNIRFEFHFVGPFPEEVKINNKCIHYHGTLNTEEEMKNVLSRCDVMVSSSYSEGMPTVIIEAMASGLAVIATDVGVVNELVEKRNGLLIPSGNMEALEKAMLHFIQINSTDLLELKKYSLEKVKTKFLWEKIIVRTIEEMRNLFL